ncbi:MAG: hypothetical protein HN948_02715 [Clostridia bacterium]|nr:hypothetical protein [Clostridia bacterium]
MAKLKTNPLAKTTPSKGDQGAADDTSPVTTSGLGLRVNEWQELEDMGAAFGLSRHGMTAYAVRYFLAKYRAGEIELESKPRLPGL